MDEGRLQPGRILPMSLGLFSLVRSILFLSLTSPSRTLTGSVKNAGPDAGQASFHHKPQHTTPSSRQHDHNLCQSVSSPLVLPATLSLSAIPFFLLLLWLSDHVSVCVSGMYECLDLTFGVSQMHCLGHAADLLLFARLFQKELQPTQTSSCSGQTNH